MTNKKITYTQIGDYQIPNLTVPDKNKYIIGKYGNLRKKFLKEYHPAFYSTLMIKGTLLKHLAEIDEEGHQYMKTMVSAMAKKEGVNEELKANDQMEWVRQMNAIHSRAEEFVLNEIVYGDFEK